MTIFTYGEALWDCLPAGLFMGGAPLNVAYHLSQLGADAQLISATGDDQLGHEIRRRCQQLGLSTRYVATAEQATGTVLVSLEDGKPSYDIVEGVAWDAIPVEDALLKAVAQAQALVFGSLAQRSAANRETLAQLRAHCPDHCLIAFDINLRSPYDDLALVRQLGQGVDLLKLNDDEAIRLLGDDSADLGQQARQLAETFNCSMVALTAGARGAGLWHQGRWLWEDAQPITVQDTVGAGDSFMAALIHGLTAGDDPQTTLRRASRLAEFVATQQGPTPAHATHATHAKAQRG